MTNGTAITPQIWKPTLEIAVQDSVGARLAMALGADRLELCTGLSTGGLTPSAGLVRQVVDVAGPGRVHVLVRPREGGFVYNAAEADLMVQDVKMLAETAGVAGVVVGALLPGGALDHPVLERMVEAAGNLEVTFHQCGNVLDSDSPTSLNLQTITCRRSQSRDGFNTVNATDSTSRGQYAGQAMAK